jgi:hypothetical protein
MDDLMDSIDISWLDSYVKSSEGVTYLPEIMDKIKVKIMYVNVHNEIIHIAKKDFPLEVNTKESFLSENSLINIIHKYRDYDKKRYQCDSIIKYHISMDPQTIFENIHNDNFTFPKENSFFFYDLPTTIHFPPSLFVFHPINTIYIFFRELVLVETKTDPISILKKGKNKITKRVRICEDLPVITNNKTKKNRK